MVPRKESGKGVGPYRIAVPQQRETVSDKECSKLAEILQTQTPRAKRPAMRSDWHTNCHGTTSLKRSREGLAELRARLDGGYSERFETVDRWVNRP